MGGDGVSDLGHPATEQVVGEIARFFRIDAFGGVLGGGEPRFAELDILAGDIDTAEEAVEVGVKPVGIGVEMGVDGGDGFGFTLRTRLGLEDFGGVEGTVHPWMKAWTGRSGNVLNREMGDESESEDLVHLGAEFAEAFG